MLQYFTKPSDFKGGPVQDHVQEQDTAVIVIKPREAARRLGISYDTVRQLIRDRELRSIPIGARRFVPVVALNEFIETRLSEQPPAKG